MTLTEYIQKHGTAAKRDLSQKTGLRWATIHDIASGKQQPRAETAKAIEVATNGEVRAIELLGLAAPDAPEAA